MPSLLVMVEPMENGASPVGVIGVFVLVGEGVFVGVIVDDIVDKTEVAAGCEMRVGSGVWLGKLFQRRIPPHTQRRIKSKAPAMPDINRDEVAQTHTS